MLYLFLDVQLNKSKMAESMTTSSTYLALLSCSSFSSLPSASWTRLNSKPCCLIKKQFQWPPWSLGRDPLIIRPFCSPWGASKAQTQISGEVRQTLESWIPHPQYLRTPSTFKSAAPSTSQIMNAQLASNNWCQSHQNMEKEHAKHSPAHVRGQKGQRMGYHLHHPSHLGMSEELQFRRLDWYQGPAAPINQGHHEAKLVPGLIKYNLAEKMMKINIIHHLCIQNPMYTIGKRLPDTNLMSNAFPQTCFLKQISLACQACSRCSSCRAARSVLRSIGSLESKGANWRVHGNSDLISASQFPVGTTLTQDRAPWMKHQAQSHPKTGHDAWGACGSQIGEWTESPPPSHWKCWITRYSDADQGTCALVHLCTEVSVCSMWMLVSCTLTLNLPWLFRNFVIWWYAPYATKPTCNDEIEQLRRRAVREPGGMAAGTLFGIWYKIPSEPCLLQCCPEKKTRTQSRTFIYSIKYVCKHTKAAIEGNIIYSEYTVYANSCLTYMDIYVIMYVKYTYDHDMYIDLYIHAYVHVQYHIIILHTYSHLQTSSRIKIFQPFRSWRTLVSFELR